MVTAPIIVVQYIAVFLLVGARCALKVRSVVVKGGVDEAPQLTAKLLRTSNRVHSFYNKGSNITKFARGFITPVGKSVPAEQMVANLAGSSFFDNHVAKRRLEYWNVAEILLSVAKLLRPQRSPCIFIGLLGTTLSFWHCNVLFLGCKSLPSLPYGEMCQGNLERSFPQKYELSSPRLVRRMLHGRNVPLALQKKCDLVRVSELFIKVPIEMSLGTYVRNLS